jgi:uncharacterized protein with GYD domain
MGHYDAALIAEFPYDEACAKHLLSLAAKGNVTETLKTFFEAEYRKTISDLL